MRFYSLYTHLCILSNCNFDSDFNTRSNEDCRNEISVIYTQAIPCQLSIWKEISNEEKLNQITI